MKHSERIQFVTSDRLAALADGVRLRICRLLERQELSVGEVAKVFQIAQSSASRNLRVLREAGWLRSRSAGPATFYRMVLDDLALGSRKLWLTVRDEMVAELSGSVIEEDDRRMEGVLAERRSDSLAYFGRVAGEWDAIRGQLFGSRFTSEALLAMLPPEWRVVDVGCGTGNIAELLVPHVAEVVAVDQSEPMLEAARRRLSGWGNVRFEVGGADRLPLQDSSVDAATAGLVLHHMENPVSGLREMARVVRPGGVVLFIEMLPHDRAEYREQMGHVHFGFSADEVSSMCVAAGLRTPRISELPIDPEGRGPGLFVAAARRVVGGSTGGRK